MAIGKQKISNTFILMTAIGLAFLFTYASVSKILEFENFQAQLSQSPLITAYAGFVSYSILIAEVLVAMLLLIKPTRYIALLGASFLMVIFTSYIVIILNFSENIPCSCGGILEKMGWEGHLVFNSVFTILAFTSALLTAANPKLAIRLLTMIALSGSLLVLVLFISSEQIIHRENPFVRRFVHGAAIRTSHVKLQNNTLYFAGADSSSIYLGDKMAPLYIVAYDTLLKEKRHYKIQLDRIDFLFQSVHVKVVPPYFYVTDGTVPVIYRGKISDWKATVWMKNYESYFSKMAVIDSLNIAIRTRQIGTLENELGILHFGEKTKVTFFPNLLQKQIDGFFDTDGMMQYSQSQGLFVYLYYYRNQFIVTDANLKLKYRGNTIDTTTIANIKIADIKGTKQQKLASPGIPINKLCALRNELLFVNSSLRGRYELQEMWDIASIVDIYNIANNTYVSSIYVYNDGEYKLNDMLLKENNLYAIVGQTMTRYQLSRHLKITNALPAGNRTNDRKPVQKSRSN